MNKNISTLHILPRGRAWRSRLIIHSNDIAEWRNEGKSYSEIVRMLSERGTETSLSAVHAFVRVRAKQRQPQYRLPDIAQQEGGAQTLQGQCDAAIVQTSSEELQLSSGQPLIVRYLPPARKPSRFRPGDLEINDPFKATDLSI